MSKLFLVLLVSALSLYCSPNTPTPEILARVSPTPTPTLAMPPAVEVAIPWKQTIGMTRYLWDSNDLYVRKGVNKEIPLFSRAAKKYHTTFGKEGGRCFLSNYFTPGAILGDVVSYEHESGFHCGTVSGEWRYATVDIRNSTRFLDLRDFFDDDELLRAFLANAQLSADVRKSIDEKKLDAMPTTLAQLSAFLTRYDYQIFNGESYFEEDYLTRFAFHHISGDTVCVRVSATSTSTAGRANHEYADIYLPIPEKLSEILQKADTGNQGFLMKDAETKVGTKPATFESRF